MLGKKSIIVFPNIDREPYQKSTVSLSTQLAHNIDVTVPAWVSQYKFRLFERGVISHLPCETQRVHVYDMKPEPYQKSTVS
jgi:hypothetical protein